MGSLDYLPSLALEYDMWGALELVSSRIGSNGRALVVPDSIDLGRLFEPFEGQASNPWSVGPLGVAARCPHLIYICRAHGLVAEPALELLISNPLEPRAPVAPSLVERVSRPLVSNRTLRGSNFSSPGLGPREGHAYLVRDRAIKCPQSWLRSCAAGAPFQATQPRA
jgi:hypothetical protein